MIIKNELKQNVVCLRDEVDKIRISNLELKTLIDDVPKIKKPFSIFANLIWATSSFTVGGEPVKGERYPKQKTALAQNFMDIKEKLDYQNDKIDELLEYKKNSLMELDDLKLRICVLEETFKEHSHIHNGTFIDSEYNISKKTNDK